MTDLGTLISSEFDPQPLGRLAVAGTGRLLAAVAVVLVGRRFLGNLLSAVLLVFVGSTAPSLRERIERAFDKSGLSIPAGQRTLPAVPLTASK